MVERVLGKDEVKGSIPLTSFVAFWYSAPCGAVASRPFWSVRKYRVPGFKESEAAGVCLSRQVKSLSWIVVRLAPVRHP